MMPVIQGFLLGLANGGACLTSCAPVLLPYIVGEGGSLRLNTFPVVSFLGGRLAGYLAFAVFAWEAGNWIRSDPWSRLIFGVVYGVLAMVMILYGFSFHKSRCAAGSVTARLSSVLRGRPAILPAFMGLLTGLSLCPPFLTAIAGATGQVSLASSMLFFFSFFIATSIYVVPFPFAGLLGRFPAARTVGRLAAGVMGCYFLYQSLIMIYGGLQS